MRAILASNEVTMSSSDGFYIDTTPPVFDLDVFMYIDVRQGEFTPVDYQGSNNTIKSVWLCEDDENEIKVTEETTVIDSIVMIVETS